MAQMLSGWISLQRKIQSSFVWADSRVLKLWEICLFKASIKPTRFLFNGEEVSLDRGQFVTGRYTLRDEYNIGVKSGQQVSATSINRWMKKFRDKGMLDIRATNRYSVVTVLKYDEYQKVGQQVDSNRTSSGHQVDTLEQDLQDKQDNKTTTTDRQKVFNFFEQGGFGQLGGFQIQNIDEEIKDFTTAGSPEPEHMVVLGLQEALNNNVRKWSYARAVMHSWQDNKVLSAKDVEAYKASHRPQDGAFSQPQGDESDDLPF